MLACRQAFVHSRHLKRPVLLNPKNFTTIVRSSCALKFYCQPLDRYPYISLPHIENDSIHRSFSTSELSDIRDQSSIDIDEDSSKDLVNLMADTKFYADYAKTARSSCKKCKQKIEKEEMRLAKVVPNFFHDNDGEMKQYHHPHCLFETFLRARATTKIIEEADDIEGFTDLEQVDKDAINQLIKEMLAKKSNKGTGKKTTPVKKKAEKTLDAFVESKSPAKKKGKTDEGAGDDKEEATTSKVVTTSFGDGGGSSTDDSFRLFRRLCADIAEENGYTAKTKILSEHLKKGSSGDGFQGDVYLLLKLLLPGVVKVVYNLNSKQLVKLFSQIFHTSLDEMIEDLEQGDVADTIKDFFEKSKVLPPQQKSTLSNQEVDAALTELSQLTKESDQLKVLARVAKRSTANDLKMVVRLIKHDLRINSGAKHILDALDPNAYEAFKASRNLKDVVEKVLKLQEEDSNGVPGLKKKLSIRASIMTPVSPMLAEPCKSVDFAFKRCVNGMFAEIKYDGERVQVHKQGDTFRYFSRSLKPVQAHKVQHFKEFFPKAFPYGGDLVLDSEVLLIDNKTGKPLPFGTLGVHKKQAFTDANVCLFVFDCLHYNGENLMGKPIKERRQVLVDHMVEVPNRIMFSEMKHITKTADLKELMMKVFREGLEGLVLKDVNSIYEPGKRHWLKVKKDYVAEGAMADTADLVVLGGYFGTGTKGGIMSIFLMGSYVPETGKWCTVTKCGSGFDDATLEKLQKQFDMIKLSKDASKVPDWIDVNKSLVPDFIVKDPKKSQVWEITGAEFSKSNSHTAHGISIRFPRCTRMRDDKTWKEATTLPELKALVQKSKDCIDLPDFIDSTKKAKGTPKKRPKKGKKEEGSDEEDGDDNNSEKEEERGSDEDDGMNGVSSPTKGSGSATSSSATSTPRKGAAAAQKRKEAEVRRDEAGSSDESPKKRSKKPLCKYGVSCYQKSKEHRAKFDHDSEEVMEPGAPESLKNLPSIFTGMKLFLPETVDKYSQLKRYIIAFDGDVIPEFKKSSATHWVVEKPQSMEEDDKYVTTDWLWMCIKKRKLVPMKQLE